MKITIKKRTTRQVLAIERVLTPESRTALQTLPKPNKVCGVRTPLNLNDLTIGDLFSLQADGVHALIEQIASVILKVHPRRCYNERADKMLGFVFWVGRELERIAALFASTSNQPTPEEIKAGITLISGRSASSTGTPTDRATKTKTTPQRWHGCASASVCESTTSGSPLNGDCAK